MGRDSQAIEKGGSAQRFLFKTGAKLAWKPIRRYPYYRSGLYFAQQKKDAIAQIRRRSRGWGHYGRGGDVWCLVAVAMGERAILRTSVRTSALSRAGTVA